MTSEAKIGSERQQPPEERRTARSWRSALWSIAQWVLAILVTSGALAYLLWTPSQVPSSAAEVSVEEETVKVVGPHLLRIQPGTPLERKLVAARVDREKTSAPILKVTGSVGARLPAGKAPAEGRWDFNAPDLATAYADWLKARAEVPYAEKQLSTIRQLTEAKVTAQTKVKERLEKLVRAGTDPEKDLAAAQADLLQAKLEGQKDEHEAETTLKNAVRMLATLERQLFQAGIDPELLAKTAVGTAIVVAEVPEARVGLIRPGQACTAQFYAFPDSTFTGRVGSMAPTLSKERRTLRAFFEVSDPQGRLRPGMFAEVGLGTDTRETLTTATDGVLHVGQADYVLVAQQPGVWKITEIKTGEQYRNRVEVLQGLQAGDRVIGAGAILLKPFVVQDVQDATPSGEDAQRASGGRDNS